MIVYELACTNEHRFEGWFASAEDYARQRETSLLRCPLCDDAAIERRPSANVQVGRAVVPAAERPERSNNAVVGGEADAMKREIVSVSCGKRSRKQKTTCTV